MLFISICVYYQVLFELKMSRIKKKIRFPSTALLIRLCDLSKTWDPHVLKRLSAGWWLMSKRFLSKGWRHQYWIILGSPCYLVIRFKIYIYGNMHGALIYWPHCQPQSLSSSHPRIAETSTHSDPLILGREKVGKVRVKSNSGKDPYFWPCFTSYSGGR